MITVAHNRNVVVDRSEVSLVLKDAASVGDQLVSDRHTYSKRRKGAFFCQSVDYVPQDIGPRAAISVIMATWHVGVGLSVWCWSNNIQIVHENHLLLGRRVSLYVPILVHLE